MAKQMLIAAVVLLQMLPLMAQYNWQQPDSSLNAAGEPGMEPARLLRAHPNPASDNVTVEYYLEDPAIITFRLTDMNGKWVFETAPDEKKAFRQTETLATGQLPSGTYFLTIQARGQQLGQTTVVIQ